MRLSNSYIRKLDYITRINKLDKIKVCNVCNSPLICGLCKSFGRTEGMKWYDQKKKYLSD